MIPSFHLTDILQIILLSLSLSAVISLISIKYASRIGLMDIPGVISHKLHARPMPVTGGIVLITTITISLLILDLIQYRELKTILIAGWVIFLFGIWDDYRHLPPRVKLLGQLLASVLLIGMGIKIQIFFSPEFIFKTGTPMDSVLNIFITILWLIAVTNAFNFIDSMDGLAVGLATLSILFFLVVTFGLQQFPLYEFCAILLGTTISLYYFNSHPAKLFLGDSGAQTLGFMLAALAIVYTPRGGNQSSSWFVPILILGVPLFDLALVVLSRKRRKKNISKGSNDHTYHRLVALGLPLERSVLLMHGSSLVLSCIGFLCLNLPYPVANSIFIFIIAIGVLIYYWFDKDYE